MNTSAPATKQDLDDLFQRLFETFATKDDLKRLATKEDLKAFPTFRDVEEIVGRVVGEVVGDALQLIAERFDRVDERFEQMDRRFDRLEDKLESTVATVDHHTISIRELQRKAA